MPVCTQVGHSQHRSGLGERLEKACRLAALDCRRLHAAAARCEAPSEARQFGEGGTLAGGPIILGTLFNYGGLDARPTTTPDGPRGDEGT